MSRRTGRIRPLHLCGAQVAGLAVYLPGIESRVVQRLDLASTGSGEPTEVPVAAAIANAFFDATGVRIRTAPMTPGRVRAVLATSPG